HEWVAAGNEAPEGYASVEHVEEDPAGLPDLPDQQEVQERLEADFEGERIDILELAGQEERDGEEITEAELADSDLDLSADYPSDR
ncbi:hypothetical protein DJ71_19310, partial [Halorubrum sp. E3]